jgi:hypothetical protein
VSDLPVVLRDSERAFAAWLEKHAVNLGFAFFVSEMRQCPRGIIIATGCLRTSLTRPPPLRETEVVATKSNGKFP